MLLLISKWSFESGAWVGQVRKSFPLEESNIKGKPLLWEMEVAWVGVSFDWNVVDHMKRTMQEFKFLKLDWGQIWEILNAKKKRDFYSPVKKNQWKQQCQCWKYIFSRNLTLFLFLLLLFVLFSETQSCDVALMVNFTGVQCVLNTWLLTQSTCWRPWCFW